MKTSFHARLVVSFGIVVLLTGMFAALISYFLVGVWTKRQMRETIEGNMAVVREVYSDRIAELETILSFTALRPKTVRGALIEGDTRTLLAALQEVRNAGGMDVLAVTDSAGTVVLRAHRPGFSGDNLRDDAVVSRVLAGGGPAGGTVLAPLSQLAAENTVLAERASVPDSIGSRRSPGAGSDGNAGMMIEAAVPITDGKNRLIGVLVGGKLLDNDSGFSDRARQVIGADDSRAGNDGRTVALYRGTLCIAADTSSGGRSPMVGSSVSRRILDEAAARPVYIDMRPDPANGSIIAGYQAVRSVDGTVIGMMSVEYSERALPGFRRLRAPIIAGIIGFSTICALAAWFVLSKRLVRPIRELATRASEMEIGRAHV